MHDSFSTRANLTVGSRTYRIRSLRALENRGVKLSRLPFSIRVRVSLSTRAPNGVRPQARNLHCCLNQKKKRAASRT